MFNSKTNLRKFRVREGDLGEVCEYAGELLERKDVNREAARETCLIFEALMQKLIDWGLDENTDLEVSGAGMLGDYRIRVGFEGKMYVLDEDAEDSIEGRILSVHDDKLAYSYRSGYNLISITVSRSSHTSMVACVIASALAIIAYIPLSFLLDADGQQGLLADFIFPLETAYTNAMLMIGAPMTFFSLLKNLTNTYIVSQRGSGLRQLYMRTLGTSAFAILLAIVVFVVASIPLIYLITGLYESPEAIPSFAGSTDRTFAEVVTSSITPSIFEPFEAVSPIPLMVVALLCTYALCSAGKYFEPLRQAMMACYTLFSRMLHVVIAALPVFCFLAILDLLLGSGVAGALEVLFYFAVATLGILLLFAAYAIRLHGHGIKVASFLQNLLPLLRENFKIGSAIDAASYNTRYCARVFKMNREMLERNLPVLAETNLDGNCFILMFFALAFAFAMGANLSWFGFIGLAGLVLFLSLGAPNQPGSVLIGMLIITTYLNPSTMVSTAIYLEAFFGSAQNLINVIGDIVLAAIEDSKMKVLAKDASPS